MIALFWPLAFFLLTVSFLSVVFAYIVLDEPRELLLCTQRVLGVWFGLFGVVLVALSGLLVIGRASERMSALMPSPPDALHFASLLAWIVAFGFLNFLGAYFHLFLWSSEAFADPAGIVRRLALGEERIGKDQIDKVVEVAYLYVVPKDIGRLRTRSLFVVVYRNRGPLFRHALFRPSSLSAEDGFRESVKALAPLARVGLKMIPALSNLTFFGSGPSEE